MFREDITCQNQLFVFNSRDLIPEDSDCFLYVDLFDHLDLQDFCWDYSSQGQQAIHPALMLRTLFYGLTHGCVSGRRLAAACIYDTRYRILSGEQFPDRRTFDRFIQRHEDRMHALFVQVVRLAQNMGLASLGRIAIDGTKFKAQTSKHKALTYENMVKAVAAIEVELKTLRDTLRQESSQEVSEEKNTLSGEIARREKRLQKIGKAKERLEAESQSLGQQQVKPTAQKSLHDLDALPIAHRGKEFIYGYNMQAAVDETSQIIVAIGLHNNQADVQALIPLAEQIQNQFDQKPLQVLADAGYQSGENSAYLEQAGIEGFIAVGYGESDLKNDQNAKLSRVFQDELKFNPELNLYTCQAEEQLPVVGIRKFGKNAGASVVLMPESIVCNACEQITECSLPIHRERKRIELPPEIKRGAAKRNRERLQQERGKEVFRRRKAIVEPVFGNLKNKGMKLTVIGKKRVETRFRMFAIAHNVEKLTGALRLRK